MFLTLCHMLACCALSYALSLTKSFPIKPLKSARQLAKVCLLATIFCITIVLGNMSLKYIAVSFSQMIGSATPFFTAIFALVLQGAPGGGPKGIKGEGVGGSGVPGKGAESGGAAGVQCGCVCRTASGLAPAPVRLPRHMLRPGGLPWPILVEQTEVTSRARAHGAHAHARVPTRELDTSRNPARGAQHPAPAGSRETALTYAALVPVVAGVVVATGGEPQFHLVGFAACLLATAGRALKSVVQVRGRQEGRAGLGRAQVAGQGRRPQAAVVLVAWEGTGHGIAGASGRVGSAGNRASTPQQPGHHTRFTRAPARARRCCCPTPLRSWTR